MQINLCRFIVHTFCLHFLFHPIHCLPSTAPTRQITLAPAPVSNGTVFLLLQYGTIYSGFSPSEDRKLFLKQNDINQVASLQEKTDWRKFFDFLSASDYPKLIFCQNQQYFLLDFQDKKQSATVNTKTIFSYGGAYDQAWVYGKKSFQCFKEATHCHGDELITRKKTNMITWILILHYCVGYLLISASQT